ncbi:MAG: hypothetical protein JW818_01175 [Pirellulales bacterium]|nr:hypothetical protein [Pirellulales bacterium]
MLSRTQAATDATPSTPSRRWLRLPPWLASLLLHLGILLVLGMTLRVAVRGAGAVVREADVGIALKHQEGPREYFTSQAEPGSTTSGQTGGAPSRADVLSEATLSDPGQVLPAVPKAIGMGALGDEGVGDAGKATKGPRGDSRLGNGGARVRVFGAEGEGFKFVYVFDRSTSMGGVGRSALEAAKAELLASLESLDVNHQFQIIFYNQRPWLANPSGEKGKLAFGNERNKNRARQFVGRITADGSTNHEAALMEAIQMRPDVIFFLTDADEPRLSEAQLERILRRAAGIRINAIEFGYGAQQDSNNFLVRLARLSGGQHAYVDISHLKSQP